MRGALLRFVRRHRPVIEQGGVAVAVLSIVAALGWPICAGALNPRQFNLEENYETVVDETGVDDFCLCRPLRAGRACLGATEAEGRPAPQSGAEPFSAPAQGRKTGCQKSGGDSPAGHSHRRAVPVARDSPGPALPRTPNPPLSAREWLVLVVLGGLLVWNIVLLFGELRQKRKRR